ncbi:hypothetical protein ON058_00435 [Demequina sp. B12]|uniref:hypothetical protein n=1 Tax=Demequina sp. B12 TaxID=2992757 RepID=UPI00237A7D09|nr:hypothetical protein [Demequina sp. B12]MDE0571881.1 hypothetical protein [Demequina sp. B12]
MPTPTEDLATAQAEVAALETALADADTVIATHTAAIQAGTETDVTDLETSEAAKRVAEISLKGARNRLALAERAVADEALAALDADVDAYTHTRGAAEAAFEAAVATAAAAFRDSVNADVAAVETIMQTARAAGVTGGAPADPDRPYRFFYGSDLRYGGRTRVSPPYPISHGNTENRLDKLAKQAIRSITQERS